MLDIFREYFEAWGQRIKAPVLGYSLAAVFAANWDVIFYLFVSDESASVRIRFAEINTNLVQDIVVPIVIGIAFSLIYPWIILISSIISRKPIEWARIVNLSSAQSINTTKFELQLEMEEIKESLSRSREEAAIARAERNQRASELGQDGLAKELDEIRRKTEAETSPQRRVQLSEMEMDIVRYLGTADSMVTPSQIASAKIIMQAELERRPDSTMLRISTLLKSAIDRLIEEGMIIRSDRGFSLSRKGFEVFDSL